MDLMGIMVHKSHLLDVPFYDILEMQKSCGGQILFTQVLEQ
jgi:hypothetical protein